MARYLSHGFLRQRKRGMDKYAREEDVLTTRSTFYPATFDPKGG